MPVITGCAVRVPTFAKAVNFQVVRTIPSGPVVIGRRTDIRVVEGEQTRRARAGGVLRGHRRAGARGRAGARDRRAAAQALAHLRAAGHPRAQGRAAVRPARHRQDAAGPRRRRREPRPLHSPQRPGDHAEVLRRERGQAPRGLRGSGAPRAGDPVHRRDRRRRAQARRSGRRGREARRRAAPEPDGRLRVARPGHRHRRHEHPGGARSGAAASRTIRSRDRDRRPEHAGPAADPQDPHARDAARARRRPAGDRRAFARLRRRRSRGAVPGSRHDRAAPVPLGRPARRAGRRSTNPRISRALQVTREDCLAGLEGSRAERDARVLHREEPDDVRVARRARRGEAAARRGGRARAHARRDLRAGRADAAARHPARRTVGHRQDRDGARAVGRKADPAHRHRRPAALLEVARRIREGAARSLQEGAAGGAVPAVLRHDRRDRAAARAPITRRRRLPAHPQPAAARNRQPARREGRDPARRRRTGPNASSRRSCAAGGSTISFALRSPTRPIGRRSSGCAAGRCRSRRTSTSTTLARRADGLTGADLESLCKKATLLAIAEFQRGARGSRSSCGERFRRRARRRPSGQTRGACAG